MLPLERVERNDVPDALDDLLGHDIQPVERVERNNVPDGLDDLLGHDMLPVERVEGNDVPDGLDDLLGHGLDLLRGLEVLVPHILRQGQEHRLSRTHHLFLLQNIFMRNITKKLLIIGNSNIKKYTQRVLLLSLKDW